MGPGEPWVWASLARRLAIPLISLLATHVIGTVGYYLLWRDQGGTVIDALFMTFTTVATIGFGEVKPLDTAGRVLTMAIAAGGIGSLFYSFTIALDWLSSGEIQAARRRRSMRNQIDELSGHFVLAGFGRVGREASLELEQSGKRIVVIDTAPESLERAAEAGWLYVKGDASDDAVLRVAGIERAKGLIVTTGNDAANLYIVMSARLLAPQLFIVSRAVDTSAVPKLERAGANRAVSPYAIGGRRMAHLILSPRVVDFFETALHRGAQTISIGEIQIGSSSTAAGNSLDMLRQRAGGATILAVLRGDTGTVTVASGDLVLDGGDHLLALGTDAQLEALEQSLGQ
ncbi:MAG: NAD-binding protein [Kofleriaceae bacterium]|nr:NAD-binding protein [Kofleriaceae bacterium]